MKPSEAKQIVRDRAERRCIELGVEFRDTTMTAAVLDTCVDLIIAVGAEMQQLEDRIEDLERRNHAEDNHAREQIERN